MFLSQKRAGIFRISKRIPYMQATDITQGGMPLSFTANGPLWDSQRFRLGNVTNVGSLEAHRWPTGCLPVAATRVLPTPRQRATSSFCVAYLILVNIVIDIMLFLFYFPYIFIYILTRKNFINRFFYLLFLTHNF